jgi:hypothetical protein
MSRAAKNICNQISIETLAQEAGLHHHRSVGVSPGLDQRRPKQTPSRVEAISGQRVGTVIPV